jgi:type I restriction enzyme S subunit
MKKYDQYKNSGVEWLGEIPEHWEVKKFKHVFSEKRKTTNVSLPCGSISFGKVVYKDDEKIPESTKRSYQVLSQGDFLINPLNLNYDLISLRIALSDKDVVVSSGYIILNNNLKLNKNYFKWLLHIFDVVFMKTLGSGVRQTLSFTHIANCELVFPSIEEQNKMTNFLDDKTAKIDQAIAIKQKQIELLKERRQILIHKAVTRGLNENVKLKNSGVEWIGQIPEHWEVVHIRRLVDIRDGTHDTPLYVEDEIDSFPLVTSKDFEGDIINFENIKKISKKDHFNISKRSGVQTGDVLMSMIGGNIGKSVIIAENHNFSIKNVALFKTYGNLNLSKFIRYYFESGLLQKQIELKSRGGAQGFLSLGDIRNLVFFKLPQIEQLKIIIHLDYSTNKIATAISLKDREIEKLKEYKMSLIDGVVTGKVRVC